MTVQCPGCSAHISIASAVSCPRCSTALPRPGAAALTTNRHTGTGNTFGLAALVCCVPLLGYIIYQVAAPSPGQLEERQVQQALATCQRAIRTQALYDGADRPPYVPNRGGAGEFQFVWPSGSFHFTNAFGARLKMSASCSGDLRTGTITGLTVNGQTIR
jgi:hypothetical protein